MAYMEEEDILFVKYNMNKKKYNCLDKSFTNSKSKGGIFM